MTRLITPPGDKRIEISFNVFGPDGDLVFADIVFPKIISHYKVE